MKETNNLKHKIEATSKDGNDLIINIRLNDECGNGHQDFSITGDIYKKGKPKIDKYYLSGGCIHEEILAVRPDLSIFVNLHLCDFNGVPMHAVANMMYHMFKDAMKKEKFCNYYRISSDQYSELISGGPESKIYYALKLKELGVLKQWKEEAKKAIKILEELTGKKFKNDSERSNLDWPKDEEVKKFKELKKEGYFSPEKIKERKIEAENKEVKSALLKLIAERDAAIKKARLKCDVYTQVFLAGGKKAIDNCIFYHHNKTVKFNWQDYKYKLSDSEIDSIIEKVDLPEGVEILKPGREL